MRECVLDLKGRDYFGGVIMNDGRQAILCGANVRAFDCESRRFLQTVSRARNAAAAVSHDQKTLCLVNASKGGRVEVIEFAPANGLWTEKGRAWVKGMNSDGGTPLFSGDDRYLFFGTRSEKLWRYARGTGLCECIWQREYPDQIMDFDLAEDRILVGIGTNEDASHAGFDILGTDGSRLRSLRCHRGEDGAVSRIIRSKWLNREEFISVPMYESSSVRFRKTNWKTADVLPMDFGAPRVLRTEGILRDFCVSPDRRRMAFSWLVGGKNGAGSHIGVYTSSEMKAIFETDMPGDAMGMRFSPDSRYFLICSPGMYLRADLGIS